MTLEAGTKLARYEIRSQLCAGGMGEVYLAFDTELDRRVAIKILPENLAADQNRPQRFIQEAKAASALNHSHILTIHEIGSTENTRFIVTEFIDGNGDIEQAKAVVARWHANIPTYMLDQYVTNLRRLRGIAFDAVTEEIDIQNSNRRFDEALKRNKIENNFEVLIEDIPIEFGNG